MGRSPIQGKTSISKRRMVRSAWETVQFSLNFENHSRATFSKVTASAAMPAFSSFRVWLGSMPLAMSLRASSRRSRASLSDTSG